MIQTSEFTENTTSLAQIREHISHTENTFVVRYTDSIPDGETLRRLIDEEHSPDKAHYLSAVFVKIDGQTDVIFGHAQVHHQLVDAIEQERGKKVTDWSQIQLDLDGETPRFEKIGLRSGFGMTEDNLKLLLGRIDPQVFLSQEIPINIWTQSDTFSYDPIQRELKKNTIGVAPGKTVTISLGKINQLY